jgi:hypothetical protein
MAVAEGLLSEFENLAPDSYDSYETMTTGSVEVKKEK